MKNYIDFINEEEEVNAGLSRFKFRFGFELEAYVTDGSDLDKKIFDGLEKFREDGAIDTYSRYSAYGPLLEHLLKDVATEETYSELIKDEEGRTIQGDVKDDMSLEHDWEHLSFEFNSPVFPFSKKWIRHVIFCLQKWIGEDKIFTDDKCGFHNHISFEGMKNYERRWIYAQFAANYDDTIKRFGQLVEGKFGKNIQVKTEDKVYEFYGEYAELADLSALHNAIEDGNETDIRECMYTAKYSFFNLHPSGTIEWRGPRNFMNKNVSQNLQNIQQFYFMLMQLVRYMILYYNKKEIIIYGEKYSKQDFIDIFCKDNFEKEGGVPLYIKTKLDGHTINNIDKIEYVGDDDDETRALDCNNSTKKLIIKDCALYSKTPSLVINAGQSGFKISFVDCFFKHKKIYLTNVSLLYYKEKPRQTAWFTSCKFTSGEIEFSGDYRSTWGEFIRTKITFDLKHNSDIVFEQNYCQNNEVEFKCDTLFTEKDLQFVRQIIKNNTFLSETISFKTDTNTYKLSMENKKHSWIYNNDSYNELLEKMQNEKIEINELI